jgi:hypothetical protein
MITMGARLTSSLPSQQPPEFWGGDIHEALQDDFYNDYDGSSTDNDDDNNNNNIPVNFRQHRNDYGDLVIFHDDDDDDDDDAVAAKKDGTAGERRTASNNRLLTEHGFLRPGTVVQIEVGDLSLARKAWKKRRRSDSPLLVPCSILNVDRSSMVRWNLLFLLEKFGCKVKSSPKDAPGFEISLLSLARYYRTFLKSSLQRQVDALGFASSQDMMHGLFNKNVQEAYGVLLEERTDGITDQSMLYLTAPISRHKALLRTVNAPMMQFRLPREKDHGDSDTLTHTGYVRSRIESRGDEIEGREYSYLPLSAALRVSQKEDLDSGRVVEGSILAAAVFDYDVIGDGGSPLLTLTLDPGNVRKNLSFKADRPMEIIRKPKFLLGDLKMGDGPFRAKIVKMSKGEALVDFSVGCHIPGMEDNVKVLGALRYKDALEFVEKHPQKSDVQPRIEYDDDDFDTEAITSSIYELDMFNDVEDDFEVEEEHEEEHDGDSVDTSLSIRQEPYVKDGEVGDVISHLFEVDSNPNLIYADPETGESSTVEEGAEIYEVEDDDVDLSQSEEDDDDGGVSAAYDHNDEDPAVGRKASVNFDGFYEDIADDDMSSLFVENEDGSMTYRDPETGETMVVDKEDEEYQGMVTMKSLIDAHLSNQSLSTVPKGDQLPSTSTTETKNVSTKRPRLQRKILSVGDYVNVYVLDAPKQSMSLRVTTNPLVKGLKPKDIKKEGDANKKLCRLRNQIGGNLNTVLSLKGRKVNGIIKATSNAGEWVYVQPLWKRDFPVGIGRLNGEGLNDLSSGDYVECQFDGIDYDRGQLALQVLQKLDDDAVSRINTQKSQEEKKRKTINVKSTTRNHSHSRSRNGNSPQKGRKRTTSVRSSKE